MVSPQGRCWWPGRVGSHYPTPTARSELTEPGCVPVHRQGPQFEPPLEERPHRPPRWQDKALELWGNFRFHLNHIKPDIEVNKCLFLTVSSNLTSFYLSTSYLLSPSVLWKSVLRPHKHVAGKLISAFIKNENKKINHVAKNGRKHWQKMEVSQQWIKVMRKESAESLTKNRSKR